MKFITVFAALLAYATVALAAEECEGVCVRATSVVCFLASLGCAAPMQDMRLLPWRQ